jgi:hypothetical protein
VRTRALARIFVLILLACVGTDMVTLLLPGAFSLSPGPPADVIHAPSSAVVAAPNALAARMGGPGRPVLMRGEAGTRAIAAPTRPRAHPRPGRHTPRSPEASHTLSSDTPDDD